MSRAFSYLNNQDPMKVALAAVIVIGVVYYLARKTVGDVAQGVGSVVSGNNAITENQSNWNGESVSAYQGKGVIGTIGAAANTASGGLLSSWGEGIGGWLYDVTH